MASATPPPPSPTFAQLDLRYVVAVESIANALQRVAAVLERPKVQVPKVMVAVVGDPVQEK